jgi:intergrase/recombinase
MVVNEKDNAKYFQKVLETTGFGIKMEKSYVTDNSLAYKIFVEEGADVSSAKLTLYKFNEETMQNEIVKSSYYNTETNEYDVDFTTTKKYSVAYFKTEEIAKEAISMLHEWYLECLFEVNTENHIKIYND